MTLPQFKNIGIETTSICNSDCAVCPRGPYFTGRVTSMTMDLFERIVLDLHASARPQYLVFGGMGDPSCDKKLIERLRFCREHAPELALVVDSNMAVWKKSFTDAIVEERLLDVLRASIFGITDEGSERAYGVVGQAAKARKAMDYLIERNHEAGNPVKLGVYTLLGEHDAEEVALIKEAFWDHVEEFEVWRPHSWSNLMPELRVAQKQRRKCHRVENFEIMIRTNGDVCACSMDINSTIVYGNLAKQTFNDVYYGKTYRDFRAANAAGDIEKCATCRGCTFINADDSEALVEAKPIAAHDSGKVSFFARNVETA